MATTAVSTIQNYFGLCEHTFVSSAWFLLSRNEECRNDIHNHLMGFIDKKKGVLTRLQQPKQLSTSCTVFMFCYVISISYGTFLYDITVPILASPLTHSLFYGVVSTLFYIYIYIYNIIYIYVLVGLRILHPYLIESSCT